METVSETKESPRDIEIPTFFKCNCAHCGQIIEYLAKAAGTVVECPKCRQKSQLPDAEKLLLVEIQGPPMPKTKDCPACGVEMKFLDDDCANCENLGKRKVRRGLAVAATCAVLMVGSVLLAVIHQRAQTVAAKVVTPAVALAQPQVRMLRPAQDLKPGKFYLEQPRGNDLVMAVGDVVNVSDNVYHGMRVDLDLLDAAGAKVGTVNDYSTELGPNQTWHIVVRVNNPKATSVKFAAVKQGD